MVDFETKPSLGFIGLGKMGWPMASRLAASGYDLTVLDSAPGKQDAFVEQFGGRAAASPADLAQKSDVLITILPNSAIVDGVLFGKDGAIDGCRPGTILIEMTSGQPSRTRSFVSRLEAKGAHLIDAPVSGGVARAETGELAIMVGGERAVVAQVEPLLRRLGSSIVHVGAVGSAHAMKALNNLVSAGGFLIGIEALLIGKKFGLSPDLMVEVLNASSGMNNSTLKKFRQFVLSRKFDAGFSLDLLVKDLSIALSLAAETDTTAPYAALCRELWAAAAKSLGAGHDHTEMAKFCETISGVSL